MGVTIGGGPKEKWGSESVHSSQESQCHHSLQSLSFAYNEPHVIERVAGTKAYSFLDGFSRYNQLSIDPRDQHKMLFAIDRGTYAYKMFLFGLTNALATFQRLMCHIFKEFLKKFLEVYVDDLCVISKKRMENLALSLKNVIHID